MQEKEREQLKAEMMAAAAASIEELVSWMDRNQAPNLREIEEAVLKIRQQMSEQMTKAVVQRQESVRPVPGPVCAKCGEEMRYKDSHTKQVTSWAGEIEIERGYYYCDRCRRGLFPPG